ncbi:hypothetical protein [Corallococcus sp. EGB]|uniref:hypothetical protein n=1 Tax=Corallococcus sp. EGB TaxID=1521117 RepID=UPI001CBF152E|nr:hypothetical protein [Corallococcus sp. EGB]
MGNVKNGQRLGTGVSTRWGAVGLMLAVMGSGCAPGTREASSADPLAAKEQAALSYNSLSFNGLSFNGLSFNGLSFNGLSFNGLSSEAFTAWFNADPALADEVMRYVVRCAVPAGQTRSYTEPQTNTVHTWAGLLGLTPGWAGGAPATVAEQQVISACLAAHTNPFGVSVPISVLGRDGLGAEIPVSAQELATFAWPESCFFGNLFQEQGLYAGSQNPPLDATQSTTRACAVVDGSGMPRMTCAPLTYVGRCSDLCTSGGTGGLAFANCTVGGVTFQPITTRVRAAELAVCGDGICQVTESCGASNTYDACAADCGACP